MPTTAPVRTVKVSETDETYDPYTTLIAAIVARAVDDATGHTLAPGPVAPSQIQAEAVAWLQDEDAVRDLVELCGYDAEPVLVKIRAILARQEPVPVPVAPQLSFFEVP